MNAIHPVTAADAAPIRDAEGAFRRNYNTAAFQFPHALRGDDGLFNLPELVALAGRLPQTPEFVYWSNGKVGVTSRWEHGTGERLPVAETISGIADNNSMVILKHTEQDPVFGPILQRVLGCIVDLSGEAMRRDVIVGESLILVSSPNRITNYHIDAETNFLLQVVGDKTLSVFNPADRTLMTEPELESFHAGDWNGAVYKPERQNEAQVFDLVAGTGVHVPVTAPHWVQNGNNVSIALSINYELKSVRRLAMAYRLNRLARRAGLRPPAPDAPGVLAGATRAAATGLAAAIARKPGFPVWRPPAG